LFAVPRTQKEERGETLDEALLNALNKVDPQGVTASRVYRGGVLLAQLAYKPAVVSAQPPKPRRSGAPGYPQTGTEQHADKALYATLVGDFVETCLGGWNTVDPRLFWDYVGNRSLDATFLPTLPTAFASAMDRELRAHPLYIGTVTPDLGNPLHRYLFVEVLFKDAFIRQGAVVVRAGYEGTYDGSFYGADKFSVDGMIVLSHEEFERSAPQVPVPASLSARGLVTEIRMKRRMALNVHQKIAASLSQSESLRSVSTRFEWDVTRLPDAPEEVEVQARKLTDYLLNAAHPKGKTKAAFFRDVLGIVCGDWSFLHAQLVDGLGCGSYEDVRLEEHGIRFSAILPVTGRNGRTATIQTAWIVRSGERASLVTAHPAAKDAELERSARLPDLVPDDLAGAHRWQAIFDLAHAAGSAAAEDAVPKPMFIDGSVYMAGECGHALVVVRDARRGFARWLKTTGNGRRHYSGGYHVCAFYEDQSADRAEAYATAFATVLRRNGVPCKVEKQLT
jgi:hypothetical protein